ncbi:TIGR02301 family protein [Aquamicrobium sp. LC103]|uniref:TIGR02301 family protein n=1 Tax=Aquamicrobium sp. LC103 TaxID=1120658 RepID=UPI00063EBA21|nr:TIGR02301 family protein [Aquamicrobium sp. LC103]
MLVAVAAICGTAPARAAESPFEGQLLRLSEILGSLHFLRNLCGETGSTWRDRMETLLEAENPDAERRARFIASFNRGYRAFEGSYGSCTPSAISAIERYMKEGAELTKDTAVRFGN